MFVYLGVSGQCERYQHNSSTLINEKKTTLNINFRTDNNQLQTKENRNERENN